MKKTSIGDEPIYDARTLGAPRMAVLGLQHMFAMFGATVLVPTLTGLSVSATLLFAGIGTLLFHLLSGGKVPVFLGSSFAFLGGYAAIAPMLQDPATGNFNVPNTELLPYACFGVMIAGLLYVVLAGLFKAFGAKKVMRFFPPIVTGPIIIAIGLTLSSSAIANCSANWWIALVAIVVVIACNIWGRGMVKIVPILLGVLASYIVAAVTGNVDFTLVKEAAWIGVPFKMSDTVFSLIGNADTSVLLTSVITIAPIAIATIIEHIGDISAVSSTCERNYIADPGLHRTLSGRRSCHEPCLRCSARPRTRPTARTPACLRSSRVYDPRVIRLAAVLRDRPVSFCPKFAALIRVMPTATIGGVSPGALRHDLRRRRAQRRGEPRSTSPRAATSSSPR